jgi:CysZ protein
MMSNPVTGAGYFFRGLSLLNKPGVRRFVIIPLLINILIFAGLIWLSADQFGGFIDWMTPSLPDWLLWLTWLLWLIFGLMAFIVLFFGFSILANLVGAPFNSYLAAAVEQHLTGQTLPDTGKSLWQDVAEAVLGELKKILYYLLWAIPLLILNFIPGLNLLSPVLWAVFGAWMLSLEYLDYPLGNYGLTFTAIRRKIREQRMLSLGFGGAVMLATLIPLFNFLVMPVAVAGATALRVEQVPVDNLTQHEDDKLTEGK